MGQLVSKCLIIKLSGEQMSGEQLTARFLNLSEQLSAPSDVLWYIAKRLRFAGVLPFQVYLLLRYMKYVLNK